MNTLHVPTIGIIGYGYVGKAMYQFFKKNYHTIWYDPYIEHSSTKDEINACDLGVVCVMTSAKPDGSCDTSIVESTMEWLYEVGGHSWHSGCPASSRFYCFCCFCCF